jgi:hypothetical protein
MDERAIEDYWDYDWPLSSELLGTTQDILGDSAVGACPQLSSVTRRAQYINA